MQVAGHRFGAFDHGRKIARPANPVSAVLGQQSRKSALAQVRAAIVARMERQ
jgi:hypothetical protein